MPPLEIEVRGWSRMMDRMDRLARFAPREFQRALRIEAEVEMTEMKKRTPVRTGVLRSSGRVEDLGAGVLGVRWVFGGPGIPYAIRVHEDLEAFHRVGQAKFLESVLDESAPYLAERVARRMRQLLGT